MYDHRQEFSDSNVRKLNSVIHTNHLTFFRIYFTEKLNLSSRMLAASKLQTDNNM